MKTKLFLRSSAFPQVELESIDESHLEFLRRLKNENRHCFFHQQEISHEQQEAWYRAYAERPDDWMFVIRHENAITACVGFRTLDGAVDLYNFLKDESAPVGGAFLHNAFDIFCAYAAESTGLPLRGRVLRSNRFVVWIKRHAFVDIGESIENGLPFVHLEQDAGRRLKVPLQVQWMAASE